MLDVSGGLIEDEALVDPLLNDEEATVALGDSGDGDFGLTSRHMPGIIATSGLVLPRREAPLRFAGRRFGLGAPGDPAKAWGAAPDNRCAPGRNHPLRA